MKEGLRLWRRLVEPATTVRDVGDRKRAELLAGLLTIIVPLGWMSGVAQLLVIRGFAPTFAAMALALTLLFLAYLASRTRHFRVGGAVASMAPVIACAIVAMRNPDDRVWYGFMCLGAVLASAFLSVAGAAVVAAITFATTIVLVSVVPGLGEPARSVPPLALQLIFLPSVLLVARHRDRLEQERHAMLAETVQSRRLEALGRLAGGVAHDFNNLLTVIAMNAEYLRKTSNPEPERLEEIGLAASRATDLVRQLLTFARQEARSTSPLDLSVVIAELRPLLARLVSDGVEIESNLAANLPAIRADRAQVEQVVMNLVMNANDAMPDGGTVTISAVQGDGGALSLRVTDTGHGMSADVAARAFEPFFTTKEARGTGLGLATVYGIVQQSGGTITFDTVVGRGTTFLVELPTAPAEEPAKSDEPPGVAIPVAKATILVVDDERVMRDALARILSRAGFHVVVASDGDDALRLASEHDGHIDILVTDLTLPGSGGLKLAHSLRARAPRLRVLFVSGNSSDVSLEGAAFLEKPFAPDELVRRVRDLTGA